MKVEDIHLEDFHLSVVFKLTKQILVYNPGGTFSVFFFNSHAVICSAAWNGLQELKFEEQDSRWTKALFLNLCSSFPKA